MLPNQGLDEGDAFADQDWRIRAMDLLDVDPALIAGLRFRIDTTSVENGCPSQGRQSGIR